MISHLVLFTLKPGVVADDLRVVRAIEGMSTLPERISLIRGWEHGPNLTPDAQAADYALRALFDDEADLHAYFEHPAHLPVVDAWDAVATLSFADFRL